jgi:hypothetical protein
LPPGDARALSERLVSLVNDPSGLVAAGELGLKIVRERFEAGKTVERLLRLAADSAREPPLH